MPLLRSLAALLIAAMLSTAALAQAVPGTGADGGGSSGRSAEESGRQGSEQGSGDGSSSSQYYFMIDRLNAGLGEPPSSLDLETPQAALESFLFAARGGDYETAAHVLDLRDIEPGRQPLLGPELARRLLEIIDRKVWIDWEAITDRPDGLNEVASSESPVGGDPRRSLRLELLEVDERPVSIRLNRLKPKDQEPVWVFSQQTVGNIGVLYHRYGPTGFEAAIPQALKKEAWWGLKWWELIALPAIVVVAFLTGALVYKALSWLARIVPGDKATNAIEKTRMPTAVFVATLAAMSLTRSILTFSAKIDAFVSPLLVALLIFAILLAMLRAIDGVLDVVTARQIGGESIDDEENTELRRRYTNIYAARRIVVLIVVLIAIAIVLVQTDVFSALGLSLLASAGVLSIIIGLAAQTVLGNILSSLQIAIAKPIEVGDSVNYEGDWAYVEAIHYTYVVIRTWDLRRLIVPVKYFVSNPFENWTKTQPRMVKPVLLKLDHRADVDDLRRHWEKIAKADEDVDGEDWIKTLVIGHDDEGMTVRFYCSARDPTTAWNMHCRLREQMLAYIRDKKEGSYLPRERVVELDGQGKNEAGAASRGAAVAGGSAATGS